MKKITVLILLFTACSKPQEQKQAPFPIVATSENDWVVYEGRVRDKKGHLVDIELSLEQDAVGLEADFKLKINAKNNKNQTAFAPTGKYSISYGFPNQEKGITVECQAKGIPASESFIKELNKKIKFPEIADGENLFFLTENSEKLILTDSHFSPLMNSSNALYHRSNLFTAEGYVTADSVTSEFFERNTGEKWNLAKLVEYDSIKTTYQKLATEKNEGIYLKALAYSIVSEDSSNRAGKSLVIKNILRMEKSSRFNRIN
jgi:hypothetical protein